MPHLCVSTLASSAESLFSLASELPWTPGRRPRFIWFPLKGLQITPPLPLPTLGPLWGSWPLPTSAPVMRPSQPAPNLENLRGPSQVPHSGSVLPFLTVPCSIPSLLERGSLVLLFPRSHPGNKLQAAPASRSSGCLELCHPCPTSNVGTRDMGYGTWTYSIILWMTLHFNVCFLSASLCQAKGITSSGVENWVSSVFLKSVIYARVLAFAKCFAYMISNLTTESLWHRHRGSRGQLAGPMPHSLQEWSCNFLVILQSLCSYRHWNASGVVLHFFLWVDFVFSNNAKDFKNRGSSKYLLCKMG